MSTEMNPSFNTVYSIADHNADDRKYRRREGTGSKIEMKKKRLSQKRKKKGNVSNNGEFLLEM